MNLTPGIIGMIAGLIGIIPQFRKVITTHDVNSYSLSFTLLCIISSISWISHGIFFANDVWLVISSLPIIVFYSYVTYLIIQQRLGIMRQKYNNKYHNIISKETIKDIIDFF